jgi:hypothetical protein
VHSVALLDPVCLLICYPQLLYNFVYREFSAAAAARSPAAAIEAARFLCSRDLTIAQAFCRRFHWSELMLWPDDLPRSARSVLLVLSGRDDLVPSAMCERQFAAAGHPATVLHHPDLGHGGLLLDGPWMARVVECIRGMVGSQERTETGSGGGGSGAAAKAC